MRNTRTKRLPARLAPELLESRTLLAAPALAWSTYLGGANEDHSRAIATDSAGAVYVTGATQSTGWIAGGFDTTAQGSTDAYIAKINPNGTMAWSSYIGGQYNDVGNAIAVDAAGNVYIAGQTTSEGWTSSGGAFGGGTDAFVAKIYANGQVAWTRYVGGNDLDSATGIAVNAAGQIYISGYTDSEGWTAGGYDTTFGGNIRSDGFVAKLESNGNVAWSSYVGGDLSDNAYAIALDPAGNVFVAGETYSEGWASGGYDTTYEGVGNAFVAKLGPNGGLAWSSYISSDFWSNEYGYGNSIAFAVTADNAGSAYVTGRTWSNDFDYGENAFVLKISASGTRSWISYVGGLSGNETGRGIDLDASGNVYLTGQTNSNDWVTGGFDTTLGDWDGDAFVAKLTPGGGVAWASYLGGTTEDVGRAIAVDGANIYVAGSTSSGGWVAGGFDTSYGAGFYDGFVAKITGPAPTALSVLGTAGNDVVTAQLVGSNIRVIVNGKVAAERSADLVSQVRIITGGGNDQVSILAGVGSTYIEAGVGNDTVTGGDGADLIYGGDGNDSLSGGDGIDTIYGNFGDDVIAGGLKRDSLLGGLGNDTITAGDGPDSVYGGDGMDLLRGGNGADYMEGRGKSDTLYGGVGNDTIISGAGSDLVYGEDGDDWLYASRSMTFLDTINGGTGTDRYESDSNDTVIASEVNLLA